MKISDVFEKLPSANEIKGGFGERVSEWYSNLVFDGAYVLRDVLIDGQGEHKSQIDMIIVGSRGLYVVEVKNFDDAKIYGDGMKRNWYYYLGGHKYEFYNPIAQNRKHIEYLKSMLSNFENIKCFSIVLIFCRDFKVSNVNFSGETDTAVCSSLPALKKAVVGFAETSPVLYSDEETRQIYDCISQNQYAGKEKRIEHKKDVQAYNQQLKEERENSLCPYCKVPLVLRKGRYGQFYGCPNYPNCKYTAKIK